METTSETFDQQQGMDIIQKMLTTAKNQISEDGFMYLLWGWLVMAASLANFGLIKMGYSDYAGWAWIILMFSGGIASWVYGKRKDKQEKVKTYVDGFMGYIWTAFGVSLGMVLGFQFKLGLSTYPMVLVVYGMGTFLSGGALKFRPLIIGGICCWILAIVSFAVNFEIQLLIQAAGVLVGYIVPGYLLRAKFANNIHVQRA